MAVNTILRAIVSIFAIGIAMVAFMPAVYDLYYNQDLWQTLKIQKDLESEV